MTKLAYITDIIIRSFFIFIVGFLLISYSVHNFWSAVFLSLLVAAIINIVYEMTFGKKYWRQLKQSPKKPRRSVKAVLKDFWLRAFSRNNTKGFVWAGIVILLMSFMVRLNIYYIVFACVIFAFAALTRFAPPAIIKGIESGNQTVSEENSSTAETK
jgi:uncharacterized membrane-anchored protein YitT (DUF2179 family)